MYIGFLCSKAGQRRDILFWKSRENSLELVLELSSAYAQLYFLSFSHLVKWLAIRTCKPLYNSLLPWQQEYFLTPADDTLFWEYMEIGKHY